MPSNILSNSVDTDNLFAAHVTTNLANATGYQVAGVDIQNRYDVLTAPAQINAGARIPAIAITTSAPGFAADTDLSSIYCGNASQYAVTTPSNGTNATASGWTSPKTWTHTLTVTFANATALTSYFLYGGRILVAPGKASGTAADNALVTMFGNMGTLVIYDAGHYRTGTGGTINNAAIGGSNIGTTVINLYSTTDGSPYTATNYYVTIQANAASGLATSLTITTYLVTVTAGTVADTYTGIYTSNINQRNHPTQVVPTFGGTLV